MDQDVIAKTVDMLAGTELTRAQVERCMRENLVSCVRTSRAYGAGCIIEKYSARLRRSLPVFAAEMGAADLPRPREFSPVDGASASANVTILRRWRPSRECGLPFAFVINSIDVDWPWAPVNAAGEIVADDAACARFGAIVAEITGSGSAREMTVLRARPESGAIAGIADFTTRDSCGTVIITRKPRAPGFRPAFSVFVCDSFLRPAGDGRNLSFREYMESFDDDLLRRVHRGAGALVRRRSCCAVM